MTFAGLLLSIAVGLLPVGAALDAAFRKESKRRVAAYLSAYLSRPALSANLSSSVFDRIFGRKIWSRRAFLVSISLAFFGLLLTLGLTAILSGEVRRVIGTYLFSEQSVTGWLCVSMIVLIVVVSDFLSYSQTRIFIRSTERNATAFTSTVFICADFIASVAIFIGGFALANMLCMLIIAHVFLSDPVTEETSYSPVLIANMASRDGIQNDIAFDALNGNDPWIGILAQSMSFDPSSDSESVQTFANLALETELGGAELSEVRFPYADYTAELKCIRASSLFPIEEGSAVEVLLTSIQVYGKGALRIDSWEERNRKNFSSKLDEIGRSMESDLASHVRNGNPECPLPYVEIIQKVKYRDALAGVGLSDLYLSSLFSTSWIVGQSVPYKFSKYQVLDIGNNFGQFITNAYDIGARSVFGIKAPDAAELNMSAFFSRRSIDDAPEIYIPMSSLVATSLLSSFLFLAAGLARVAIWGVGRAQKILLALFPLVDTEKFIFSIVIGVTSIALLLLSATSFLATEAWRVVWLSLS